LPGKMLEFNWVKKLIMWRAERHMGKWSLGGGQSAESICRLGLGGKRNQRAWGGERDVPRGRRAKKKK